MVREKRKGKRKTLEMATGGKENYLIKCHFYTATDIMYICS